MAHWLRSLAISILVAFAATLITIPAAGQPADPASAGPLSTARADHTATLLPDGRVLILGGTDGATSLSSAELWDPATGTSTPAGSMNEARAAHTATLLSDGRVLVTGGSDGDAPLASAEVWDPATGTSEPTGSMSEPRSTHEALLMPDGRVLIVGGPPSGTFEFTRTSEIYDPARGAFDLIDGSIGPYGATGTLLDDGRLLAYGGTGGEAPIPLANLWDPSSGATEAIDEPATGRIDHTATLLPDGRVLLTGGRGGTTERVSVASIARAETWDPARERFRSAGSLARARHDHTATLLPDGRVLVVGGVRTSRDLASERPVAPAEIWEPTTEEFASAGSLVEARRGHTATLLADGRVLISGGADRSGTPLASTELWDPATGRLQGSESAGGSSGPDGGAVATDSMATPRFGHTSTTLSDGRVLIAGGASALRRGAIPRGFEASAEIWDPATDSFVAADAMDDARYGHAATLLPDGRVLVSGGWDGRAALATLEVWDPSVETFTSGGSLSVPRFAPSATLLPDGRVLVIGGASDIDGTGTTTSAEIVDPAAGTTTPTGSMAVSRWGHTASLLPDGRVLVIGGSFEGDGTEDPDHERRSAEVWDPSTGTFTDAGTPDATVMGHSATSLPGGRVLVVGQGKDEGNSGGTFGIGLWSSTASMWDDATHAFTLPGQPRYGRRSHTATTLADGRVLIAAGSIRSEEGRGTQDTPPFESVELFDPTTDSFARGAGLGDARSQHAASLLPDGRVLLTGGLGIRRGIVPLASAELWDPEASPDGPERRRTGSSESVAAAAELSAPRYEHTSTTLDDGRVLIVGGASDRRDGRPRQVRATAEVWDPSSGSYGRGGSMADGRLSHTATRLADGRVLVAGGSDGRNPLASTELWDPAIGAFGPASALSVPRLGHTATLLADGRVLLVGGASGRGGSRTHDTAELFDPATGSTVPTGSLEQSRHGHAAALLADGRVLIVGGAAGSGDRSQPRTMAEVWDPATGDFSRAGDLADVYSQRWTATTLTDGRVLVVGLGRPQAASDDPCAASEFADRARLWDPATAAFSPAGEPAYARDEHTATLLPDGRVLIVGGQAYGGFQDTVLPEEVEIYDPATDAFSEGGRLRTPRAAHDVSLVADGRVLVSGGYGYGMARQQSGALSSSEIWEPGAASEPVSRASSAVVAAQPAGAGDGGGAEDGGGPRSARILRCL